MNDEKRSPRKLIEKIHRPRRRWPLAGLALAAAVCLHAAPAPKPAAEDAGAVLRRQTQEMLDAISSGSAAVWERYLDDKALYTAEDGTVSTKAEMVSQIRPLPEGVSGTIRAIDFKTAVNGSVAVTSYVSDEDEDYHGHKLHCQYRSTDTWVKTPAGWRLLAGQVLALRTDPPAVALTARQVEEYSGRYALTPAIAYEIRGKDGGLEGQRTGRPAEVLMAEAPDVLFVPGQPRYRKVFLRGPDGRIKGFVERREAWDIEWTRQPPASAAAVPGGASGEKGEKEAVLSRVDHLLYATPDLDRGIEEIEKLLGVRAAPGGQHPGGGTRNALVSLGPTAYLEIIAPDPEQPAPKRPRPFGIDGLKKSRLVTWAAKGSDLERLRSETAGKGFRLSEVRPGSRKTPDGTLLSWSATGPETEDAQGILPFFIDWGQSPHPARTSAQGATLIALRAEHPDAQRVQGLLRQLGLDLPVEPGAAPALVAVIDSPRGRVELR